VTRSGIAVMARTAWRADPARALGAVIMTLVVSMHPVFVALLIRAVTNAVVAHDAGVAVAWGVVLAAVVASWLVLLWFTFGLRTVLEEKARHAVEMDLAALCMAPWSIAHHEDPEVADELALIERDVNRLAQVIIFLLTLVGTIGQLVFAVVVLADVNPLLLLLPVLGVLPVWASRRGDVWRQEALEEATPVENQARELYSAACSAEHAAELAVLGVEEGVRARHRELSHAAQDRREKGAYRAFRVQADSVGLFAAAYVAAVVVAILFAVSGDDGVGDVLLTVTLAAQITGGVAMATDSVTQLVRSRRTMQRYLGLRDLAEGAGPGGPGADPVEVDDAGRPHLAVRGVGFRYRGADEPALRDVHLDLHGGQTIAVVGANGAGKTTLAKLLCRLYDPTDGAIEWNGRALPSIPPERWRAGLSAAYQDFVRFEVTAGEAIGLGDLPRIGDEAALRAALARADGANLEARLPDGLATGLGQSYPDGTELSTGQWQKLAVARSMMRPIPRVLILDEPTASLDAETEYRLFRHYAEASGEARRSGRSIVVIITHRLGSVRFADRIVVMDGGTIAETGSHDELVASGGRYAELYRAQSEAYSIDEPEGER
jgi:ATP-binding cassette subfamily B protein